MNICDQGGGGGRGTAAGLCQGGVHWAAQEQTGEWEQKGHYWR